MIPYSYILQHNYPTVIWSIEGDDYDTIDWRDESPKPTRAELDALLPATQLAFAQKAVDHQRRTAYLAESDPLYFKWQRGEATEADWLAKIAEIRARFPDPT